MIKLNSKGGVVNIEHEPDNVNRPSHYQLNLPEHAEAKDVIRAVLGDEKYMGWCRGSALKYMIRAGKKTIADELEDLKKAKVFLEWEIETKETGDALHHTDPEVR